MPARTSVPRYSPSLTRSSGSRVVAVLSAVPLLCCGCRPAAPKQAPARAVTVNIEALLPAHPAWQDVKRLDALLEEQAAKGAAMQPAVALASAREPQLHPPLAVSMRVTPEPPPSVASIRAPSMARLAQTRAALDSGMAAVLDRNKARLERSAAADVAARRAELVEKAAEPVPPPQATDPRLLHLQLQAI